MKKAVFLDRDGTIIRDMVYLNDPAAIDVFTESYEAIKLLNQAGYVIILVTNQSGVARGIVQEPILKQINQIIVDDFRKNGAEILDVYYCAESVDSNHANRKPNPGMLLDAAEKHQIDLKQSWMVGDRMTDVDAGLRAGCKSILLQNSTTPKFEISETLVVASEMLDAARIILGLQRKEPVR